MLAISTQKVNDPGETTIVPGTEEFKINNHPVQGGAFRGSRYPGVDFVEDNF
jgi:hypothetical protein